MKPFSSSVDFDPSLKRHITFIFHFERDPPYIDVRSPSYVIFDTESDVCTVDYDLNVIKFRFEFIEVRIVFNDLCFLGVSLRDNDF